MPRDLTFEAIKLLSQRIVSNPEKIPEGAVFQATSCMNPDDAEVMGFALAMQKRLQKRDPKRAEHFKELMDMFEVIFISKWIKGELTHLGFRAGLRYQENIDVAKDAEVGVQEVDEAGLVAGSDKE